MLAGAFTWPSTGTGARAGTGASAWTSSGTSATAARCTGAIATAASSGAVRPITITRATGLITAARAGTGATAIAATGAAGTGVSPRTFTLCFSLPANTDIGRDYHHAAPVAHVFRGVAAEAVPRASRALFALRWATGAIHALLTFRAWRFFYTHAIYANLVFAAAIGDTGAPLLMLSCRAWVFRPTLTINPHLIGFALRNALRPHLVQIRRADALTTSERGARGAAG